MKRIVVVIISLSLCVSVADAGLFQGIKARKGASCRRSVKVEVKCEKEQCDAETSAPVEADVDVPPAPTDQTFAPYQIRVLELVNKRRTRRGLTTLTLTKDRTVEHSRSQAGRRVKRHAPGFREVMYWGSDDPDKAVNWWMNSPGHRRNILNRRNRSMGVGLYGTMWTARYYE